VFAAFGTVGILFTVWMAVEAVRRGQTQSWLWIILFFGPIGAAVYFFSELLPTLPLRFGAGLGTRRVGADEERRALADVKRLDNCAAWAHYAGVLRARGQFAKAAEAGARALERDGQSIDAHYERGLALLGSSRHGDAVPHLRAVVDKDRGYQSGDALFALGRAQEGLGDFAAARQSLEALAQTSSRPEVLFLLARVQGLTGDREAALRSLKRIVDEAEYVPDYLQRDVLPWVKKAKKAIEKLGGRTA
jgi:hypothetical protein